MSTHNNISSELNKYLKQKSAKDMLPIIVSLIIFFIIGIIVLADRSTEYIAPYAGY